VVSPQLLGLLLVRVQLRKKNCQPTRTATSEDCDAARKAAKFVFAAYGYNQIIYGNDPARQPYLTGNFSLVVEDTTESCLRFSMDGLNLYFGPGPAGIARDTVTYIQHAGETHVFGDLSCEQVNIHDWYANDVHPDPTVPTQCDMTFESAAAQQQCGTEERDDGDANQYYSGRVYLRLWDTQTSRVLQQPTADVPVSCTDYMAFNQWWVAVDRTGRGLNERQAWVQYMSLDVIRQLTYDGQDNCAPWLPPPGAQYLRL